MSPRQPPRRRSPARRRLAAWLVPVLLGGCALKQTVVLVADPSGHVGEAEVATAGGSQRLTKAGEMTSVRGPSAAPAAVTTADAAWIATTFSEALAAEPAPPEKTILYFEPGTTTLDARSRAAIAAVAAAVKRRGAISVHVSGHTDATGSAQVNDQLAMARAERIKALLLEQGVAPGLLSVSSHGKGNPAVPTPYGVPEPRNRRVEVIVQ